MSSISPTRRPASGRRVRVNATSASDALADLVGEEATRHGVAALREDIADLFGRLEQSEARAEMLPHRRKYLLLVIHFLRRLLELHLEFVDEVEVRLAAKASSPDRTTRERVGEASGDAHGRNEDYLPTRESESTS